MALRVGDHVKQTSQPEWGIGRVLSIAEAEKVTIFLLRGGKRMFYSSSPDWHTWILTIRSLSLQSQSTGTKRIGICMSSN